MTRVISCRVIDPTSPGDGNAETALAPPAGSERYLRRPVLPAVEHYGRLPCRWLGCGSGFWAGANNTAGDIPTGLLFDVLA